MFFENTLIMGFTYIYYFFYPHICGWIFTYEELKLKYLSLSTLQYSELNLYLWGIETYLTQEMNKQQEKVESLPMRNWNLVCHPRKQESNFVESLPMRNWNYYIESMHKCYFFSWIFTYEELKPWSGFVEYIASASWIFTYEELKLTKYNDEEIRHEVESLPMRNWN